MTTTTYAVQIKNGKRWATLALVTNADEAHDLAVHYRRTRAAYSVRILVSTEGN